MNASDQLVQRYHITEHSNDGPTMLLVHGYGCDQSMWNYMIPNLSKDYRVITFDLIGSGQFDASRYDYDRYASLDAYADDIIEICDGLALEDTILVGHSVSATSAALATAERPDLFSQLVMIAPSPCYLNDGDYQGGFNQEDIEELLEAIDSNYLGWSSAIAPVIVGDHASKQVKELEERFCRNNPDIARHFARVTFTADSREDMKRVQVPTLVIQVAKDNIAPRSVGYYVQQQIPGSHIAELDTVGHCPHMTEPTKTEAAIRDFLGQPVAATA